MLWQFGDKKLTKAAGEEAGDQDVRIRIRVCGEGYFPVADIEIHGQCGITNTNRYGRAVEALAQLARRCCLANIAIENPGNGPEGAFERVHCRGA